jgi:very-short-patch-repair endonuclease
MARRTVDQEVDKVARRQFGVFSHDQLHGVGGTDRMVHSRLSSGRWILLAPGVYAIASHPADWHRNLMGAVLGEPRAVVGGTSSAVLHGLAGFRPGRATIIVPRGSNHRSPLALVRERSNYRSTVVDRIPVLTVGDTFFDVAGLVPATRTAVALDEALAAGEVSIEELQSRYLDLRRGRRRGVAVMRRLIAARSTDEYVPPSTALEGLLYAVLDRPTMPRYRRQASLEWAPDQRVDALLVDVPVIVEADGRRWHTRVQDFARDRERDRVAALHGYRTLRYTWADLRERADEVERELRAVAGART